MQNMLPDREFAEKKGWLYQVQWAERGLPCFIRCQSGAEADAHADALAAKGIDSQVIDLRSALQLN